MNMSHKELAELLRKNPGLKAQITRKENSTPVQDIEKMSAAQKPKYRNVKVYEYSDGVVSESKTLTGHGNCIAVYDSIKEYNRWCELLTIQKAGLICDLKRQIVFVAQDAFAYKGERIAAIQYKADFTYIRSEGAELVVEDVKPFDMNSGKFRLTKDFTLKWKMLKARYPHFSFEIY